MATDRICVGAIAGAFGGKGEVRLKSFCAQPEAIAAYAPLYTEDGSRSFTLRLTRPVTGGLGARLSGVSTKEQADALKGVGSLLAWIAAANIVAGVLAVGAQWDCAIVQGGGPLRKGTLPATLSQILFCPKTMKRPDCLGIKLKHPGCPDNGGSVFHRNAPLPGAERIIH